MPSFASSVLKVASGSLLAQVIALGTLPLLTRMYLPDDFGKFAIFISIVMWISPVSTLGYHTALMLSKRDRDALHLLLLSFASVLVVSLITLLSSILIISAISYSGGEVESWYWLISVGIFLNGCLTTISFWGLRKGEFGRLAYSKVLNSISDRLIVFSGWAYIGNNPVILMVGKIIGTIIAILIITTHSWKHIIKIDISVNRIKYFAFKYRDYPLKLTWAILLNMGSLQLPLLLVAFIYEPAVSGAFLLTHRALQLPLKLVGDSIRQVFFRHATKNDHEGKKNISNTGQLVSLMLYIAVISTVIIIVFGAQLFSAIFGDKWYMAGVYASVLVIGYLSVFIQRPLSVFYDIYEKHNIRLLVNVIMFFSIFSVVFIGWALKIDPYDMFLLISIVTLIINIYQHLYLMKLAGWTNVQLLYFYTRRLFILSVVVIGLPIIGWIEIETLQRILLVSVIVLLQVIVILLLDHDIKRRLMRYHFFSLSFSRR